jgi:hypothetical protein
MEGGLMMRKTFMEQHFKYYVYVCPGHIRYFNDLYEAQEYARAYDVEVKEL